MRGLRVAAETLVGLALVIASLFAVDCVKGQKPAATPAALVVCRASLHRAPMLCNTTTRGGAYECAVCPDPDRACLTTSHVYCVTAGCDDPNCGARP